MVHLAVINTMMGEILNLTHELVLQISHTKLMTALLAISQGHVMDIMSAVEATMAQRVSVLLVPLSTVMSAL
jgi:hypothetical protein